MRILRNILASYQILLLHLRPYYRQHLLIIGLFHPSENKLDVNFIIMTLKLLAHIYLPVLLGSFSANSQPTTNIYQDLLLLQYVTKAGDEELAKGEYWA